LGQVVDSPGKWDFAMVTYARPRDHGNTIRKIKADPNGIFFTLNLY
jgi:hypothetical protein